MTLGASRQRLTSLVDAFAGRRLVVAGDYVLDRFLYGHPKRVSREAPVLILRFWKEEHLPGGAGNTAANVRSLGGNPLPVGAVGEDDAGGAVKRVLEERGVETSGIITLPGYRTPTKTRILAGAPHGIKQQVVRYDRESSLPEDPQIARELSRRLVGAARESVGAILSDYGYGAVARDAGSLLRGSLPSGAPVLVDSRHGVGLYSGADAITPANRSATLSWRWNGRRPIFGSGPAVPCFSSRAARAEWPFSATAILPFTSPFTGPTRSPTSPERETLCSRPSLWLSPLGPRRSRRLFWPISPEASSS